MCHVMILQMLFSNVTHAVFTNVTLPDLDPFSSRLYSEWVRGKGRHVKFSQNNFCDFL